MRPVESNRINLKLLQTFMSLAETLNFREAADQSGRSQSAVSTRIKALEEQVGLPLFYRTTRSVRLTAEGESLLAYARRAMEEVENGLRQIREASDLSKRRIGLACTSIFAATVIPDVLREFEALYPDVTIELQELKSAELFERLRAGKVDFAIGPKAADGDFHFRCLIKETVHVFAKAEFLDEADEIPFAKLAELPLIRYPGATILGAMLESEARAQGFKLTARYECIQAQTLIALARAGLGVAIMTGTALRAALREGANGEMRGERITDPALEQEFSLITLKGKCLSPGAEGLAGLIREFMAVIDR